MTARSRRRSPRGSTSPTLSSRRPTRRRRPCRWSPARRSARRASSAASGSASPRCSAEVNPGRFISLEGVETREPGGSEGAEMIRRLLLEGPEERWTGEAEALLFAAARADHVARTIRPAVERGAWVLSDRFLDSSLAYQG